MGSEEAWHGRDRARRGRGGDRRAGWSGVNNVACGGRPGDDVGDDQRFVPFERNPKVSRGCVGDGACGAGVQELTLGYRRGRLCGEGFNQNEALFGADGAHRADPGFVYDGGCGKSTDRMKTSG